MSVENDQLDASVPPNNDRAEAAKLLNTRFQVRNLIKRMSENEVMDLVFSGDMASRRLQRAAYACPPGFQQDMLQEHADFMSARNKCNSEMNRRTLSLCSPSIRN